MSSRGVVLCVVAIAGLAGCSEYGARPHSPAQGGRAWLELSSPHFRVITDLSVNDAEGVAREFEADLAAIDEVEFEHPRTPTEVTTIVVFSDASDFHAFFPRLTGGEFLRGLPGDLEPSRFVVLPGLVTAGMRVTCLHELTHDLFERNFGPAPPWLEEGWAQYYSTLQIEPSALRVGGLLPHLSFTLQNSPFSSSTADGSYVLALPVGWIPQPSQLLTMDRRTFYAFNKERDPESEGSLRGLAVYMGSWALVHMMHDGPQKYQVRYRRFLEIVRDAPVQSAWQSAFAGISVADFDRDFRLYLASEKLTLFEYPRRKTEEAWSIRRRSMSDAEVRVLWSRLSAADGPGAMAADVDLYAALREAPGSAEAHYYRGLRWLQRGQFNAAERELLEAVRLAPNDPRFLLAELTLVLAQAGASGVHPSDAVQRTAAALARVADSATQLRILALVYRDLGDEERALGFARRASALSPLDSLCLDAEAQVLSGMGRNQEALELQRSAVAFLPEGAEAPAIFQRLQAYEDRASKAP